MALERVIGERFELGARARAGGMATVYRARDSLNGQLVALKILDRRGSLNEERFEREACVLAELSHPGLVRYIAHGVTEAGARYLAMEWLEGNDLGERLARGPLGVAEALALVRRAAEALGAAHARGIIHRDIKPSNLFLVGGRTDRIKVVDFGLARQMGGDSATRTGMSIGTPRYMAPEQVQALRDLDVRVDVYGLGAVLYGCVAGRPAFAGADDMAVLSKVLLEDPPPLRELVPGVPPSLAELVGAMLAKDRQDRPADVAEVVARIDAMVSDPDLGAVTSERPLPMIAVTGGEQRLLSVVLVDARGDAVTTADDQVPAGLRELLARHGERFARLPDGSMAVTVAGTGTATDQSARAARLALGIRAHLPGAAIALATGRGQLSRRLPTGDVIDRAAAVLRRAREHGRRAIVIDEVTDELLGGRFAVRHGDAGAELLGERDVQPTRTLLGRATACVGREPELGMLEAVWQQCVDDRNARAVLVTGEPGVGKSRLRYELIRRLQQSTPADAPLQLWLGRGDPMRAGTPFGLLGPAIRSAAGVLDGEPAESRRGKLRERIGRHLGSDDATRVSEFLGELVGVPFPEEASAQLRTARHDPRVMSEQMRRAWEDWVGAETANGPLLIVLEDLHWGDWPTVKFIDSMLVAHADRPIMVLALARPDVKTVLPGLWEGRLVSEIALGNLPRRASERLAREVLGDRVTESTLSRLVEQSAGNALFLEELIRAAAEGKGETPPESVLAMMQARLDRLPPDARRVLRAASVFSHVFRASGVAALVGGDIAAGDWLEFLIDEEVVVRRGERKVDGEDELVFRHALMREAAYSLLTEADRRLGHRLTAEWLERAGETDALVLAEHLEFGGELEPAAARYQHAAEQALEASDLNAATAHAGRGLACLDQAGAAARHPVRGALHLVTAEVHAWGGHFQEQEAAAQRALACLERGEPAWCRAADEAAHAAMNLGRQDALTTIATALYDLGVAGAAHRAYVLAAANTATLCLLCGHPALAERLVELVRPLTGAFAADDPAVHGAILRVGGIQALFRGDLAGCLASNAASVAAFDRAGDRASAYRQRGNQGAALIGLGLYAEATELLTEAVADSQRLALPAVTAVCRLNLGVATGRLGDTASARAALARAIDDLSRLGMRRTEAEARAELSLVLRRDGDLAAAAAEADRAVAIAADCEPARAHCLAHRAQVALAAGRADDALVDARAAIEILRLLGGLDRTDAEPLVRLTWAEALDATGDRAAAARAIAQARIHLEETAGRIGDPGWRASYVDGVPDNARTIALDRAWNP